MNGAGPNPYCVLQRDVWHTDWFPDQYTFGGKQTVFFPYFVLATQQVPNVSALPEALKKPEEKLQIKWKDEVYNPKAVQGQMQRFNAMTGTFTCKTLSQKDEVARNAKWEVTIRFCGWAAESGTSPTQSKKPALSVPRTAPQQNAAQRAQQSPQTRPDFEARPSRPPPRPPPYPLPSDPKVPPYPDDTEDLGISPRSYVGSQDTRLDDRYQDIDDNSSEHHQLHDQHQANLKALKDAHDVAMQNAQEQNLARRNQDNRELQHAHDKDVDAIKKGAELYAHNNAIAHDKRMQKVDLDDLQQVKAIYICTYVYIYVCIYIYMYMFIYICI